MASQQTIEIDCSPGSPRPDDLFPSVIADTGLTTKEPVLKFFGNYTWDYSDVDPKEWKRIQPVLKARIEQLYHKGRIRYGSW